MRKADVGMVGLGVMGESLALNFESRGYTVAVYDRTTGEGERTVQRFLSTKGKGKAFVGAETWDALVNSLEKPRKIILMIKAGSPVDEVKGRLLPLLSPGDVIVDGGNSDFRDTERRVKECGKRGVWFVGAGISGGKEGALKGPSIMPGGAVQAWPEIKSLLQSIAARLDDGTPCCRWIGPGGAGHFVKMVHNGIEYSDMQLIAEACSLLKSWGKKSNEETAHIFERWNRGVLNSFLIGITAHILRFRDERNEYLLDHIRDVAGQKGTGKWSIEAALDRGVPWSLTTQAVYARILSEQVEERACASRLYAAWPPGGSAFLEREETALEAALYASKIVAYAQGFSLLKQASAHYGWDVALETVASVWKRGCIIRSALLDEIEQAYRRNGRLENLLLDETVASLVGIRQDSWRHIVAAGISNGVSLPCMSAALSYFDGLRTVHSAANLIQAQRDYFGAHTYERTDAERGRFFHTDWNANETMSER